MAFPANLTNAIDGVTDVIADHLNHLEAKVGIDGSAVTTSLDYLLKNAASISPGHKHVQADILGLLSTDSPTFAGLTINAGGPITTPVVSIVNGSIGIDNGAYFRAKDIGGTSRAIFGIDSNNIMNIGTQGSGGAGSCPLQFWAGHSYLYIATSGNVGIGTAAPDAAALLHLSSTTKGFLPPVMTTVQKTAISTPPAGLVVYDSTLNKLCVYNGSAWETITSS